MGSAPQPCASPPQRRRHVDRTNSQVVSSANARGLLAKQAADLLQTSRDTLIRKARAGEIPAAKLGREWRFREADLDAWLAAGGDRYEARVEEELALELAERKAADSGARTPLAEVAARKPEGAA